MKTTIKALTVLFIFALPLAGQNTESQSWTSSDGRVLQAKFIKLDGESVVIEKNGKEFTVPFAKLNAESVTLAKKLGGITADPVSKLTPPPAAPQSDKSKELDSDEPMKWGEISYHNAWNARVFPTANGDVISTVELEDHTPRKKADIPILGLEVVRLDGKNGTEKWRSFIPEAQSDEGFAQTSFQRNRGLRISNEGDLLITTPTFRVISGANGKEIWSLADKDVWQTLVNSGFIPNVGALIASEKIISVFDTKSGARRWEISSKDLPQSDGGAPFQDVAVTPEGDVIVLFKSRGKDTQGATPSTQLAKVSATDGKIQWTKDTLCKMDLERGEGFGIKRRNFRRIEISPTGDIWLRAEEGLRKLNRDGQFADVIVHVSDPAKETKGSPIRDHSFDKQGNLTLVLGEEDNLLTLRKHSAKDGSILWESTLPAKLGLNQEVAWSPSGDKMFWKESSWNGEQQSQRDIDKLTLHDTATGKVVWSREKPLNFKGQRSVFTVAAVGENPLIDNVAAWGNKRTLTLLSGKDGSLLWTKTLVPKPPQAP